MSSKVKVRWNVSAQKKMRNVPDKIMQSIAREILNRTYPTIPMSSALNRNANRGRLRRETLARGVQKNNMKYYLESPTYYSKYVYNFNDNRTNWSTPGTNSQWFDKTWNKQGKSIFSSVVERNKL